MKESGETENQLKYKYLDTVGTEIYIWAVLSGSSSVGRASASQAEGRGFDPRLPLKELSTKALKSEFDARFTPIL